MKTNLQKFSQVSMKRSFSHPHHRVSPLTVTCDAVSRMLEKAPSKVTSLLARNIVDKTDSGRILFLSGAIVKSERIFCYVFFLKKGIFWNRIKPMRLNVNF